MPEINPLFSLTREGARTQLRPGVILFRIENGQPVLVDNQAEAHGTFAVVPCLNFTANGPNLGIIAPQARPATPGQQARDLSWHVGGWLLEYKRANARQETVQHVAFGAIGADMVDALGVASFALSKNMVARHHELGDFELAQELMGYCWAWAAELEGLVHEVPAMARHLNQLLRVRVTPPQGLTAAKSSIIAIGASGEKIALQGTQRRGGIGGGGIGGGLNPQAEGNQDELRKNLARLSG